MQTNNHKFENEKLTDNLIGETRLVFKEATSSTPPAITEKAPEKSPTKTALADLKVKTAETAKAEVEAVLGDTNDLKGNTDKLGEAIERLMATWEGTWEKFCALFAPFGLTSEKVTNIAVSREPALRESDTAHAETEREDEDGAKHKDSLGTVEYISDRLFSHPTWMPFLERAERTHGVPVSMLVSFIQIESSFNPKAAPTDKKADGNSKGLAQAMKASMTEYKNERYGNFKQETDNKNLANDPDPFDPETSIDFMAWHINKKIAAVNKIVDDSKPEAGFKPEYKLSIHSPIKYIYLSYNSGEEGYLKFRRYQDNPTQENFMAMENYQTKQITGGEYNGKYGWEMRLARAEKTDKIAGAYEKITKPWDRPFDSPPLAGNFVVTSNFGSRLHPIKHVIQFHEGVDIGAPLGTPVKAVYAGEVRAIRTDGGGSGGNWVEIFHPETGATTRYFHLSKVEVKPNQSVDAGTEIGKVGSTGTSSTGSHLHLELRGSDGIPRNPKQAIQPQSIA